MPVYKPPTHQEAKTPTNKLTQMSLKNFCFMVQIASNILKEIEIIYIPTK